MSTVGSLFAPGFEPATLSSQCQEGLKEALLRSVLQQTCPKLGEQGEVKALIGEFESHGVLPVDATAHGFCGLAVREVLSKLEDADECPSPGSFGGLSLRWEQVGKLRVLKERAELVSHRQVGIAFGKGGMSDASSFFGNRKGDLDLQAHGRSPTSKIRTKRMRGKFCTEWRRSCKIRQQYHDLRLSVNSMEILLRVIAGYSMLGGTV